ncbi:hypothetical protein DCS_03527 [Drechmeria coniospora]|uniref:Glyoxalase-like domain-containing protein n=1 Tax=Drechmeria coniospora TaxID=98403 RepID=A0A151GHC0_DRECN|nr:hypothetical protein DCS_03527 [Drechmeria coniospora]KYK56527.1 hypothetical protein DCS_03527 [Drechmeria coniospora]ODA76966.1 hypothetical protein RJ55_07483 [Drechmeria coniospora]
MSGPTLDHIVILVSQETLERLPTRLHGLLTVAPGGVHADGLTSNKLILFEDGVYIEFVAFFANVDAERRRRHRWGRLREGAIIDWAYTLPSEGGFASIQMNVLDATTGITYDDPVAGGRTKPDGTMLRWAVAAARDRAGNETWPGRLPFWCLDRTPRHLRVPYEEEGHWTRHACGARGVSSLTLAVPNQEFATLCRVYDAMHYQTGALSWHFNVPSESTVGRHAIWLLGGGDGMSPTIKLTLLGDEAGAFELLPGLVVEMERWR